VNKGEISSSMRDLAGRMQRRFPQLPVHEHVRDAAAALKDGRHDGAKRHLNAAIASLAPLQLTRAGLTHDEDHQDAKTFMDEAHRHLLLVKDNEDMRRPVA
jgi:hypothetical protein